MGVNANRNDSTVEQARGDVTQSHTQNQTKKQSTSADGSGRKSILPLLSIRKRKYHDTMHPHTQEVFQQAMLYVLVFYFTHAWSTSARIIQQLHPGRVYFQLAVVHAFCDPLQGFLNFLVYQRPRYRRIRSEHPEMSHVQVLRRVVPFSCLNSLDGPIASRQSRVTQSHVETGKTQVESSFTTAHKCSSKAFEPMGEGGGGGAGAGGVESQRDENMLEKMVSSNDITYNGVDDAAVGAYDKGLVLE
jgi:hypothetical protein